MNKYTMNPTKDHAFGKDIYLLGKDESGINYWLESPHWDCSWYWGFGFVETYTNNRTPSKARDIESHQHIDSSFMGQHYYYDHEKQCFRKGTYINNIYDSPLLVTTTFNEGTGWQLSELFRQFYLLKDMAAFCYKDRPGCHITISPVDHGSLKEWYDKINKKLIPDITAEVLRLLSPKE